MSSINQEEWSYLGSIVDEMAETSQEGLGQADEPDEDLLRRTTHADIIALRSMTALMVGAAGGNVADAENMRDAAMTLTAAIGDLENKREAGPLSTMVEAMAGGDDAAEEDLRSSALAALEDAQVAASEGGSVLEVVEAANTPDVVEAGLAPLIDAVIAESLLQDDKKILRADWVEDQVDKENSGAPAMDIDGRERMAALGQKVDARRLAESVQYLRDQRSDMEPAMQAHGTLTIGLRMMQIVNDLLKGTSGWDVPPRIKARAIMGDQKMREVLKVIDENIDYFGLMSQHLRDARLLAGSNPRRNKFAKFMRGAKAFTRAMPTLAWYGYRAVWEHFKVPFASKWGASVRDSALAKSERNEEDMVQREKNFRLLFVNLRAIRDQIDSDDGIETETVSSSAAQRFRRDTGKELRHWDRNVGRAKAYAMHDWVTDYDGRHVPGAIKGRRSDARAAWRGGGHRRTTERAPAWFGPTICMVVVVASTFASQM